MPRTVTIARMAKSAGVDTEAIMLKLIDEGIEVDDPAYRVQGTERKVARAVVKELCRGGPVRIKGASDYSLEPAPQSSALQGMLTLDDIMLIHDRLCVDFAQTTDPIDPPGVANPGLLDSAVSRQYSGFDHLLKYPDPILNAATLLYGVCNDHPFYNGNKRTALVAALAHLDRNRLILKATKKSELFNLMISVANHSIIEEHVKAGRRIRTVPRRGTADEEVAAVAAWLSARVEAIKRGETPITYRELRQILATFDFSLHFGRSQKAAICRVEKRKTLLLRRASRPKTVMSIRWPNDGRTVPIREIKHLREVLELREEDGVPSDAFYAKGVRVDRFINEYRQVLRKLASR